MVPLAIEYSFWNQRLPEVLLAAGEPLHVHHGAEHTTAEWTMALEANLQAAQDTLAAASGKRDPAAFAVLLEGRKGVAGPYGPVGARPRETSRGTLRRRP